MPVGERQSHVTKMVSKVLGINPTDKQKFDWLQSKHAKPDFGKHYDLINEIFIKLNGDRFAQQAKRSSNLRPDAYFGEEYNFIFEFDEMQHFSSNRLLTLELYPENLKLGFSIEKYKELCNLYSSESNKYRIKIKTKEFNFEGGRTAQRAYFDCFRDLLPEIHGLNPTLRISEFDFNGMTIGDKQSLTKIEEIVANYKSKFAN